MSRLLLIALIFVLSCHLLQVHCGSYWGDLITERIGTNRIAEYCKTREGLLLFPGSNVMFKDSCFNCTCNQEGLSCKTSYGLSLFGYSQCKTVIDDCKPLLVDKYNERLRCFSKIPTNQKVPMDSYEEVEVNSLFG